jgi:hypothetical protein
MPASDQKVHALIGCVRMAAAMVVAGVTPSLARKSGTTCWIESLKISVCMVESFREVYHDLNLGNMG